MVMKRIGRRGFLSVALGGLAAPAITRAQALLPVRLLVLRQPAVIGSSNCVASCIRGSLHDVSTAGAIDPAQWSIPFGVAPICDVIERPWAGNAPNISAIPAGEYKAFVREDATKSWMTNQNRRWRIQLEGVQGRSAIQFHFGQDELWSQGCFIVGDHLIADPSLNDLAGAYCSVGNGEAAIARLRSVVIASGLDGSDIRIAVADRRGLFPDFTSGC